MRYIVTCLLLISIVACREEADLELPEQDPEIVVEGFINSEYPAMNYVILTRVQSYAASAGTSPFVGGADVFITPGEPANGDNVNWQTEDRTRLTDLGSQIDSIEGGIYADLSGQLEGRENMHYRLEIFTEADTLIAETYIPAVVPLSVTYKIRDDIDRESDNVTVTYSFQDPPDQRNFYRREHVIRGERPPMWGQMSWTDNFTDEQFQGQHVENTFPAFFNQGDTMHIFLNSVTRETYEFLLTRDDAGNTGGPFASPVQIESNVRGGRGCFCGLGVSHKKVIFD